MGDREVEDAGVELEGPRDVLDDEDDWGALWWVRADGEAVVVDEADPELVAPLVSKYPAYAERPPAGPAIVVTVRRWSGWSARP